MLPGRVVRLKSGKMYAPPAQYLIAIPLFRLRMYPEQACATARMVEDWKKAFFKSV
jgi:hypothetical protein